MKKNRAPKNVAPQAETLRRLHEEAAEQLEMMHPLTEALAKTPDPLRRQLETLLLDHWHAYLEIMHLIVLQDDALYQAMKNFNMDMRQSPLWEQSATPAGEERQLFFALAVLPFLLYALAARHRYLWRRWDWRDGAAAYFSVSLQMTKDHIAALTALVHSMITS